MLLLMATPLAAADVCDAQPVSTIVALKFIDCKCAPDRVSVHVKGTNVVAKKEGDDELWIASGAPSFEVLKDDIAVKAEGVPISCPTRAEPFDHPQHGCVALVTVNCTNRWVLEVVSQPPAAFKYTRQLPTPRRRARQAPQCEGQNRVKTEKTVLDVAPEESILVQINGVDGKPVSHYTVTRERIEEKGGKVTLAGKDLLLGDLAHAPLDSRIQREAIDARVRENRTGGLTEVTFVKQ